MAKRNMPTSNEEVVIKKVEIPNTDIQLASFKYPEYVVHGCKRLNVREEPSTDSEILFDIPEGTILSVNPNFVNKDWLQVALYKEGHKEGYVMKSFTRRV